VVWEPQREGGISANRTKCFTFVPILEPERETNPLAVRLMDRTVVLVELIGSSGTADASQPRMGYLREE
jgi:hypothetical protein